MSDTIARINEALEGRYAIQRRIGEGGMATVYLADDLRHERRVALKVLKPELAAVVGADRFLAEIKTTANLQHPHILPLFDSGEANGFLFYVMPYIEGETLRDRIDRERQLPVDEALGIATAVANALNTAHEQGVIHRDIKPANILLSQGEPLVADFGIAIAVGAAGGGRLTETGLSVGTPFYMSPEQATGDQSVGPASDIYALACVLYEMLVGEPPYLGNTAQAVLGKIIQGVPVSATASRKSIPANVDAAIRKGLEKTPADRFTSARALAQALADPTFRHGEDAQGVVAAASFTRLRRVAVAGWAVAGVAIGLAGTAWLLRTPEHSHSVERFAAPFLPGQEPTYLGSAGFDLSRDGTMLVYRQPLEGDQVLMIRRWDELSATPVRETSRASSPAVSYDGLELAFRQDSDVRVLSLSGGPVRTLAQGDDPVWGPDGFVYVRTDSGAARVPSVGGSLEYVSRLGDGEDEHEIYDILPGGTHALMVVRAGEDERIVGLDLESGGRTPIVEGNQPRYLPSGHLVYEAGATMMVGRFDPKSMRLRSTPVAVLDALGFWSLSNDGKLFYATSVAAGLTGSELVWVTRDGSATPVDPDWAITNGPSALRAWAISPDGANVAVRLWTTEGWDVWVKRASGALSRLTFGGADELYPTWSPDGASVTFISDRNGDFDVWSRNADGTGEPTLVADLDVSIWTADWTPDGTALLLVVQAGDGDIWSVRPGSSEATPLFAGAHREQEPALSPDGRYIAYASWETGSPEVYVHPYPDVASGRWQISVNGGRNPRWAHDGAELFFEGPGPDRSLMSAPIEVEPTLTHGTPQPLFVTNGFFSGSSQTGFVYRVAPDDERFLLGRGVAADGQDPEAPRTILVNNFIEELNRMVPR